MNIELSKHNHMVWGYNQVPWSKRFSIYDRFFISYGQAKEKDLSFREACIRTAREISECAEQLGKTPLIFYSGGVDSETMIAAFIESGKQFSVAHIRFMPNFNEHETHYVRKFAQRMNLKILEFEVDTLDFLSNPKTFDTAVRDNSAMIELHLMTAITDQIKDKFYPVLDHPGTYLYRNGKDLSQRTEWLWKDYEFIMFYYNHCINESMSACPSFYHWSPEIILSLLTSPEVYGLVSNKFEGKITNRTITTPLYQNAFPEYNLENRKKYTGFEFIPKDFLNDINSKLRQVTQCNRAVGQIYEYHELLKVLGYDY
jgi:hypothetical protein